MGRVRDGRVGGGRNCGKIAAGAWLTVDPAPLRGGVLFSGVVTISATNASALRLAAVKSADSRMGAERGEVERLAAQLERLLRFSAPDGSPNSLGASNGLLASCAFLPREPGKVLDDDGE